MKQRLRNSGLLLVTAASAALLLSAAPAYAPDFTNAISKYANLGKNTKPKQAKTTVKSFTEKVDDFGDKNSTRIVEVVDNTQARLEVAQRNLAATRGVLGAGPAPLVARNEDLADLRPLHARLVRIPLPNTADTFPVTYRVEGSFTAFGGPRANEGYACGLFNRNSNRFASRTGRLNRPNEVQSVAISGDIVVSGPADASVFLFCSATNGEAAGIDVADLGFTVSAVTK